MVLKYCDVGLIEFWDISKILVFDIIVLCFLDSEIFKDDQGVWYILIDWGVIVIVYNKEVVFVEDVVSLNVFIDLKYQGCISLFDLVDDVWVLVYLVIGMIDWIKVMDEQFKVVVDWLCQVYQNVVVYWVDLFEQVQLMVLGVVDIVWLWNDGVVFLENDGFLVGFQCVLIEGSLMFFCGFINLKNGLGKEEKVYDFINVWFVLFVVKVLLDIIGYGYILIVVMEMIKDELVVKEGFVDVDVLILFQILNDL